jgi:hypothetical protein
MTTRRIVRLQRVEVTWCSAWRIGVATAVCYGLLTVLFSCVVATLAFLGSL